VPDGPRIKVGWLVGVGWGEEEIVFGKRLKMAGILEAWLT